MCKSARRTSGTLHGKRPCRWFASQWSTGRSRARARQHPSAAPPTTPLTAFSRAIDRESHAGLGNSLKIILTVIVIIVVTPWTDFNKQLFWTFWPPRNLFNSNQFTSKLVPREIWACRIRIWGRKPPNPSPRPRNLGKPPLENDFWHIFIKFSDSRHAQLSIYAVFDEECNFQVKSKQIRRPEAKIKENHP